MEFLATSNLRIVEEFSPGDGGSELLQNIGTFIMIKMLSCPGKLESSNGFALKDVFSKKQPLL